MHIIHYKVTPCAYAPDAISDAINYYTPHTSEVVIHHKLLPGRADVVHFHNRCLPVDVPSLIQYHSEPHRVDLETAPDYKLVLAQYHATLPEYAACRRVRNVILSEHEPYVQRDVEGIRIGYSPSFRGSDGWFDKGYSRTKEILHRVSETVIGCSYDLVQNVPLDVCLERKSRCNILIDECATGSYHRCTLEALALGKLAVVHLSPEIDRVAREAAGTALPVVNVPLDGLEEMLVRICQNRDRVIDCGRRSRAWMLRHWHPRDLAAEYVGHYERVKAGTA